MKMQSYPDFAPEYPTPDYHNSFNDKPRITSQFSQVTNELHPVYIGRGLANCVREQLLSEKRGNTAVLIDWAIRESLTDVWLTFDAIMSVAPFSEYLLRVAVDDFLIESREQSTRGRRGRPIKEYRIPNKDKARELTTPGNLSKSDHLPFWAFDSLSDYRAGMYMALILRSCGWNAKRSISFSREFLSKFLSVCKKTLRNYEREYSIIAIPQFDVTPIHNRNVHRLPVTQQFGHYLKVVKGTITDVIPATFKLALRALDMGCKVEYVQRMANAYSVWSYDIFNGGKLQNPDPLPPGNYLYSQYA